VPIGRDPQDGQRDRGAHPVTSCPGPRDELAVEFYLNKPTPDLWDKILGQFTETLSRAEETYLAKAKGAKPAFFRRRPLTLCG
jgi:hypothetical protein